MSTYKTGNPLGSAAVKDLFDNAENLDFALNSLTALIWTDRLGKTRRSFFGMESAFVTQLTSQESRFNTFIQSSGYQIIGDYTAGPLTLTEYNQLIRYNNELYKLTAATDIPFTTAGNTDETWTSTDAAHFVSVGDATLRQNLRSGEEGMGDNLIAHKIASSDSQSLTVYDKLVSMISVLDFIPRAEHEAIRDKTSTLDLTLYFQKAAAYALTVRKRVYIPAGQYYVTSGSFQSGLGVVGDGMGNSILVTGVGTGAVIESLGYWSSGDSWKNAETCVLQDFSVQVPQGNFYAYDSSFSIGYDYSKTTTETPIQLGYYKRLEIRSVGVSWSRGFSILATRNQELLITGC
ncbi:glycosyl hydrolase family 28-related protein, partial [Klebsiella pneumoniae]|nr:hypothetical protein [Klebsiella pneumoniae]MCD1436498.1 hypothetical protein [Klebsiella pneumoniae]